MTHDPRQLPIQELYAYVWEHLSDTHLRLLDVIEALANYGTNHPERVAGVLALLFPLRGYLTVIPQALELIQRYREILVRRRDQHEFREHLLRFLDDSNQIRTDIDNARKIMH